MEEWSDSREEAFFYDEQVESGGYKPIEIRFETLILRNGDKPYDWYKTLGYDKSWASKVRRGLIIPKLEDRIKIAKYFKTDSSTIWRVQDLPYIKQIIADQVFKEIKEAKHEN